MEKKRVFISVDKEAWEGTQQVLRDLKISNQYYNEMLNEFIRGQYKMLTGLKTKSEAGEQITLGSFLKMMGNLIDGLEDDQLKLIK